MASDQERRVLAVRLGSAIKKFLLQGVSKKTEFSGEQPWQMQLLWVGNTVGFFDKSRLLCCFLTTSFPGPVCE